MERAAAAKVSPHLLTPLHSSPWSWWGLEMADSLGKSELSAACIPGPAAAPRRPSRDLFLPPLFLNPAQLHTCRSKRKRYNKFLF